MTTHSFYTALNFHGDPNIGLYGFATEKFCLVGPSNGKLDLHEKLKNTLNVPIHNISVLHLDLIRILITGNSKNIVVPNFLFDRDITALEQTLKKYKASVHVIESELALGNLIILNDNGIVISPMLRKLQQDFEKAFGLRCGVTTIAGLNPLGSLAIATNKGCLVHPQIKESEAKIIESVLGVSIDVGTVNFGSPHPGSGIIANSKGFAVGSSTSGPELGRIAETLGFD